MSRSIAKIHEVVQLNADADTANYASLSQGAIYPSMHQSNPANFSSSRPILKLKTAARKSPREPKTPPRRPQSKLKPGARWSDDS
jgi:hypothetical protein